MRQLISKTIVIFVALGTLSACDSLRFKKDEASEDPIVASVDEQHLRKSELVSITANTSSDADSSSLANRYIQTWIKKQLMMKEAGKKGSYDEAELNRKLLNYKYALIVYEFEKRHIDQHLVEDVSDAEIEEYYKANKDNFTLKEVIVRLNFVKVEKKDAQRGQIDKLLKAQRDNKTELEEFAIKYASNYFLEDSTWVKFDDIIVNTPLFNHPNKVQLLRQEKLIKVDDANHSYYFRILEYKLEDQVPPKEFVKEEISKIILNKRRVALADQLQKEIYNRALENNEFKIYE